MALLDRADAAQRRWHT